MTYEGGGRLSPPLSSGVYDTIEGNDPDDIGGKGAKLAEGPLGGPPIPPIMPPGGPTPGGPPWTPPFIGGRGVF